MIQLVWIYDTYRLCWCIVCGLGLIVSRIIVGYAGSIFKIWVILSRRHSLNNGTH